MKTREPHILVFGNEKGGTGKSTLAAHVVVSLLDMGKSVAVIDIDSRQRTLGRFIENREAFIRTSGKALSIPMYVVLGARNTPGEGVDEKDQQNQLQQTLGDLKSKSDFIVVDCPGNDTYLSRLAHALADTLVTPLNDSFVDLDLLAKVDPFSYEIRSLSLYTQRVWDSRKFRSAAEKAPLDWVVTRNRLATLGSHNNQRVNHVLKALKKRINFRYVAGLNERVIYRELFPQGLTMMDLKKLDEGAVSQASHVAARFEIKTLIKGLKLPSV